MLQFKKKMLCQEDGGIHRCMPPSVRVCLHPAIGLSPEVSKKIPNLEFVPK
jgi:hypothetical protein